MNDSPEQGARGDVLRITPFEVAFASTAFEADVFPAIAADAEHHRSDPLLLEQFGMLPAAAEAVRSFVPDDAPPEATDQYRALLFQAFNYWRLGRTTYLLHPAAARFLVEAQPSMEEWELTLPRPSLYVQLPHHLFWGSVSPEVTPEPVDGMFVTGQTVKSASGEGFLRLEVLLVLGLRRDRAGFSVIPFDTEAGPGIAAAWAESGGREGGADFENILPGGEIAGLYSVLTVGEVLKLLGRILWYVDIFPDDVSEDVVPQPHGDDTLLRPSRTPYRLISLGRTGEGGP